MNAKKKNCLIAPGVDIFTVRLSRRHFLHGLFHLNSFYRNSSHHRVRQTSIGHVFTGESTDSAPFHVCRGRHWLYACIIIMVPDKCQIILSYFTWRISVLSPGVRSITATDVRSRCVAIGSATGRPTRCRVSGHPSGCCRCSVIGATASSVTVVNDNHFFA